MKKNKIALVTCYFQHNYGSQLQAFATEMMLRKLGFDFETIRIDGLKREINKAKICYFISKIFDPDTVRDKFDTIVKIWTKKTNHKYAADLASRDALFDGFANNQFHLSELYHSLEELGRNADDYSAFIVGSDQLWLPSNIAGNYYTLSFVPDGIKKIAYATSFGVSRLPKKQAAAAKVFLNRFDAIFVREVSGKRIIKELTDIDVPVVCDPTLMFDASEWNGLIPRERKIRAPYILCYFLGNNPWQRAWAKELARMNKCRIVQLPNLDTFVKFDDIFADYALYDINPLEFVTLIRDAEYVLTDSFHCVAFSNIFSKRFFVFRRYATDSKASTNSRIYSLLKELGEEDRLVEKEASVESMLSLKTDFSHSRKLIETLRKQSYQLLENALMKVKE